MWALSPHAPSAAPLRQGRTTRARRAVATPVRAAKKGGGGAPKGAKKAAASPPPPRPAPHGRAEVIFHTLTLIDSFRRATGRTLLPPGLAISDAPKALFEAPFVVVSHGTEADPIFNYGSAAALNLWGLEWEAFTALPSRRSAADAADVQAERSAALAAAAASGAVDGGYTGVRVTAQGRRFRIENATLWAVNTPKGEGLEGEQGVNLGQAATFATITWLDDPPEGAQGAQALGAAGERWRFAPGGMLERDDVADAADAAPAAAAAAAAPPPADAGAALAAARAAAEAQAAAVRALKAEGRGNDDADVAAAVAQLKALKAAVAELEQ